jgi:outer membrane protein
MRYSLFFSIALWLIGATAWAQTAAPKAFTLQQAVDHALSRQEALQNLQTEEAINAQKVRESLSRWLPQITGTLDVRYNAIRPTSILPGVIAGRPGETVPVQFGTNYSGNALLNLDWAIYEPTLGPNMKIAKLNIQLAQKNLTRSRIETILAVKKAYYNVLLSRENLRLQNLNYNRQARLAKQTQQRVEQGQEQPLEQDRSRLTLANDDANLERARQTLEQSELTLKYQMAYPLAQSIELVDSNLLRDDASVADLANPGTLNPERRVEYLTNKLNQTSSEIALRRARHAYIPSFSLFAQVGSQFQSNTFNYFDANKAWFGSIYLGGRLNVPIFDGLFKDAQVKQAKLQLLKLQTEETSIKRQLNYELSNAFLVLQNVETQLITRKNNQEIAEKVLAQSEARYKEGQATLRTLEDARDDLKQAQNNYFISLYDYVVAKLELEKARGVYQ